MTWQVLIVEDDPLARAFFQSCVLECDALHLVAAVGTVADALAWLSRPCPLGIDVLLADINLPDGSGLDVIRYAVRQWSQCEPLVISMFGDEDSVLSAIEAGAMGYIHKDSPPDDIAQTIVDMKRGASPISPMIARRLLAQFRQGRQAPALNPQLPVIANGLDADSGQRPNLSVREQEVLELIARGFSYAEIARIKNISVHTVQTHIKGLYGKLSVHSKNEAVYEATRIGLL